MHSTRSCLFLLLASLFLGGPATSGRAATVEELEQRLDALAAELATARTPGAPRVSLGGYGEVHYNNFRGERDNGASA
ncbi:MAG: hypothetical protein COZ33_00705, partial [Nitrospirae bacterium CG_4_10_14_3_um_filter_70_108]